MYYLYALSDPRDRQNYRYIGITKNLDRRINEHLSPFYLKFKSHKNNWINSLLSENVTPIMIKIGASTLLDKIYQYEIFVINKCRSEGYNLTNVCSGGAGDFPYAKSGQPRTKEHCAKIGLAQIGNTRGRANKGKKHSEEFKASLRVPKPKTECPYCGITGAVGLLKTYHFDNCIFKYDCDIAEVITKLIRPTRKRKPYVRLCDR